MPFLKKKNPMSRGFQPRKKTTQYLKTCMVCLELIDTKQNYTYVPKGCSCKPHIHDTCFESWNSLNPGSCPICRKISTMILEPTHVPVVNSMDRDDVGCIVCTCGAWGILGILQLFAS